MWPKTTLPKWSDSDGENGGQLAQLEDKDDYLAFEMN